MNSLEKCYACNSIPDDILMLACNHDLCLNCAANSFANQNSTSQKLNKAFICDICSGVTELDTSSIYELEKIHIQNAITEKQEALKDNVNQYSASELTSQLYAKNKIDTNLQKNLPNFEKENQQLKFTPSRQSVTNFTTKNLSKQTSDSSFFIQQTQQYKAPNQKEYCQSHPEEDISYFCFDCLSKCICPECIIHGVHKNHEVKTIKKAYPVVKKLLMEINEQNENVMIQIEQQREEIDRRQSQQNQQIDNLKTQIRSEFTILHQLLNVRESELIEQLEKIPKLIYQYQDYNDQTDQIEEKCKILSDCVKNSMNGKNEIAMLNFYSDLQSQQIPSALPLPNQVEIMINHMQVFETIKELKSKFQLLSLEVKEVFYCYFLNNKSKQQTTSSPLRLNLKRDFKESSQKINTMKSDLMKSQESKRKQNVLMN